MSDNLKFENLRIYLKLEFLRYILGLLQYHDASFA